MSDADQLPEPDPQPDPAPDGEPEGGSDNPDGLVSLPCNMPSPKKAGG